VTALAGILRLADALDREHVQNIRRVTAAVSEQEIVLSLDGEGDLLLAGWSLKRRAQMFSSFAGRKIRFRVSGSEA
jgi:exopolyphosphatase/guanosine-5'-triphosphate,3'-diphosphate pyrophosphatase